MRSKVGRLRRPARAQFQLMGARRAGDVAEANRTGRRDCSADRTDLLLPICQCVDQPTPRYFRQEWVDREIFIDVGLEIGDEPHRAIPCFAAIWVIQENETTERIAFGIFGNGGFFGMFNFRAECIRVRSETLRRTNWTQLNRGMNDSGLHRVDCGAKLRRFT